MSLNLQCEELELWQTPTHITLMCYSNEDGGWKGIKYRYIQWVQSHLQGVWCTQEDLDNQKRIIDDHINNLDKYKRLHFFIL